MNNWSHYINKKIPCSCGKTHFCDIRHIAIEENALNKLPEYLKEGAYQKICLICDQNTEKVAGTDVEQILSENGFPYHKIRFADRELVADERALSMITNELPYDCDLILGIGSGTINDLCKFISYQKNMDYFIIATAPSMDGYASNVAVLTLNHLKTTLETHRPKVIIGDTCILSAAPKSMIAAGVGDILGKYVCLADWKLSHLVTGEYFCDYIYDIMKQAVDKMANSIDAISASDENAISIVMESLILAGVGMSFLGNSRPASGSEHHLSHYWEMMFLQRNEYCPLHGTKVAIGTVIGLFFYHSLPQYLEEMDSLSDYVFDKKGWEKCIQNAYGMVANEIIDLEDKVGKNSTKQVEKRKQYLNINKNEILKLAAALPSTDILISYLKKLDAPYLPVQIAVSDKTLENSIYFAKDLRNRFGILQLLYDIGIQEKAVNDFTAFQKTKR